ncbi:putative phosphoribosylformylglycinamidine synthase, chloroplastic/mitochondrial [Tetrabaena socialis]|uniref:Putative phosphoribosylformylglycinamidine synthase, chloroplastic/mitochondrial n=1 Tax=Tetrabaena socialis TaxID=47790 RepID=A0A2J8A5J9_9CHLO|nr:putative phosphoribosylformylglycinamidine synthase, chloroplastic/mitochondrial [Tetrabaena socialis]|eukprot:PNH07785.1 putative phosphoribosylformylglycinamidine synthase, chloroplastic/mitochondrial [Tetrabaena socialis]
MARLALGEALTNLVWARATSLADVRASVNWMYAAKMKGEGAAMWDAAISLRDAMIDLGVACDGGKDSLSMAAAAGGETVMAPGNLVVSAYVGCPDITQVVTPDLKLGADGVLVHVDLAEGRRRMGGSALAQAYDQLGNDCPDVTSAALKGMWEATQSLLAAGHLSAGHDISDGGIATTLLEMAFAGNCGISADLPLPAHAADQPHGALGSLFAEELGLVLEVASANAQAVLDTYKAHGIPASVIGKVSAGRAVELTVAGAPAVSGDVAALRDSWEETSFVLERMQSSEETVSQEQAGLKDAKAPKWVLPFTPAFTPADKLAASDKGLAAPMLDTLASAAVAAASAAQHCGPDPLLRGGLNGDRGASDGGSSTLQQQLAALAQLGGFLAPGGVPGRANGRP